MKTNILYFPWWCLTYPSIVHPYSSDLNAFIKEVIANKDKIDFSIADVERDRDGAYCGFFIGFRFKNRNYQVWVCTCKLMWLMNTFEYDNEGNIINRLIMHQVSPFTACDFHHDIAKPLEEKAKRVEWLR